MGGSWVRGEKSIKYFNGFTCEDGTVLSVSSAAKKFGVTYARVYHAGVSIGITDEKSLKKHLVERKGRRGKIILHKTPLSEDLITDEETARLIGITTNAFRLRAHVRGRSNPSIYKKKMPKKEPAKAKETDKKEPKEKEPKGRETKKSKNLEKPKICIRGGIDCRHRSSCSDSRLFLGKHHDRYKEDGSCWEEDERFGRI